MAQLPPDGDWLMQQIDGDVVLYHRYTEEVIVRYPAHDADLTAKMQRLIHDDARLNAEQKCFAHFWAGYFYAHASGADSHLGPTEAG